MVTLTNNSTSTPSVTDGSVGSVSPDNTLTSDISVYQAAVASISAGINNETTGSYAFFPNIVSGNITYDFQGGYLQSFFAYVSTIIPISGNAVAGVYIDGQLIATSKEIQFSNFESLAYWQEFEFDRNVFIPKGVLYLVLDTNDLLLLERHNVGETRQIVRSYYFYNDPTRPLLPSNVSTTSTSNLIPQIYITYKSLVPENLIPKQSTWNDFENQWTDVDSIWDAAISTTNIYNI